MSSAAGKQLIELAAGDVVEGDMLVSPTGAYRLVLRVETFDELTGRDPGLRLRFIVAGGSSESWEGARSGQAGRRAIRLDEQGLRPFRPSELVTVLRGG